MQDPMVGTKLIFLPVISGDVYAHCCSAKGVYELQVYAEKFLHCWVVHESIKPVRLPRREMKIRVMLGQ